MAAPDTQLLVRITQTFFQRNNPVAALQQYVHNMVDTIVNFNSHRKLMKYRFLLYRQQMSSLERNLAAGAVAARGDRMDRLY